MRVISLRSGVVLAALLVPSLGFAQATPPSTTPPPATAIPPTPAPSSAAPAPAEPAVPAAASPASPPSATTEAAVDQRIRTLQSQLGITEAQMPLWSAFAQTMRENAASTEALFTRRAATVATMSATDNMHSYAGIARAYAEDTERLATAFDSLYASLSETQRQAANTLFRQQAAAAAHPRARR